MNFWLAHNVKETEVKYFINSCSRLQKWRENETLNWNQLDWSWIAPRADENTP